jgi:hypothetical protein
MGPEQDGTIKQSPDHPSFIFFPRKPPSDICPNTKHLLARSFGPGQTNSINPTNSSQLSLSEHNCLSTITGKT